MASLKGRKIIVPPARIGQNILANILTKKGALVYSFPEIASAPLTDDNDLAKALSRLHDFQWLIISGELSARNFIFEMEHAGYPLRIPSKLCVIGHLAVNELKSKNIIADWAPREHTPEAIATGLSDIKNSPILLIREALATQRLPEYLRSLGAFVEEVAGYKIQIISDITLLTKIFSKQIDYLAFANPTTVRIFTRAFLDLAVDMHPFFEGITIFAVGRETRLEMERHGIQADITSGGHIALLVEDMEKNFT
jgi:uroporphyrinogen III methyltransferase/synthase